jgi:DNA mismatch repair protein MSH4
MTMLYKIAEGVVKEPHYGLALAKVVPLPGGLVDRAQYIAQELDRQKQKRRRTSTAVIQERKRKLILNLKEHLVQAQNGVMEGEVLSAWLKELQKEFVTRMTAIDATAASEEEESEDDMGGSQDENEDAMSVEYERGESERPSTKSSSASNPTVVTVDSYITSTESSSTVRAVSESASINRAVSENEF